MDFKTFLDTLISGKYHILFLTGIKTTLLVSTIALFIGLALGVFFTIIQNLNFSNPKLKFIEKILNFLIKAYVDIIRGTPIMVQLIFFWLIVFGSVEISKTLVGGIAFGLNAGAWISEIIRSGVRSIDKGQMEGGLSLGFSKTKTLWHIIIPQVFKNMLPSLIGEYIALIKDSSILSTIGAVELNRAGDIMIANTGNAIYPLIMVALLYLILTSFFAFIARIVENKLKKNENRI